MKTTPPGTPTAFPPRLSMDAYADFVEASLRDGDRARAAQQKQIEERIRTPFRIASPERERHAPPGTER